MQYQNTRPELCSPCAACCMISSPFYHSKLTVFWVKNFIMFSFNYLFISLRILSFSILHIMLCRHDLFQSCLNTNLTWLLLLPCCPGNSECHTDTKFFSFSLIFWNILGKNTFVFSSLITPVQCHSWSAAVSSEWQQHQVGVGTTGKPKPSVRNVIGQSGSRRLCCHIALGPFYTSLLAQLAAKLLPRTSGLYDDEKLLPDFPSHEFTGSCPGGSLLIEDFD